LKRRRLKGSSQTRLRGLSSIALFRIREVKREIRVLGVAARRATHKGHTVVGVIFRGGLYLDGILRAESESRDITGDVVEMIVSSPHHSQVRVILLDEELLDGATADLSILSKAASRPVIAFNPTGMVAPREGAVERFEMDLNKGSVPVLSLGIDRVMTERILRKVSKRRSMPEALKIAYLLVSAVDKINQHNL
jgi:endonuclease V-like protein UPF0215 family